MSSTTRTCLRRGAHTRKCTPPSGWHSAPTGSIRLIRVLPGREAGRATSSGTAWASLDGLLLMAASRTGDRSETAGPWVKPEQGMKKYVWSETRVEGGKPFDVPLDLFER